MPTAIENMQRAMRTFEERSKKYGDNYKHFGRLMGALYPKGFSASSEEEWNRLGLIVMIASKLSRYVKDPYNGHLDSIHDLGVYAFMLEEIDSLSCRTCGALFTDGRCLSCGAKMDARMEEVLASACEHVYANQKCIVCGEKEPEHKLGWQVIQEANKVVEFPHCGPDCLGGAAHFARAEDGVFYQMERTKEYEYKNPSDCPHHHWKRHGPDILCDGCGINRELLRRKDPKDHDCF